MFPLKGQKRHFLYQEQLYCETNSGFHNKVVLKTTIIASSLTVFPLEDGQIAPEALTQQ